MPASSFGCDRASTSVRRRGNGRVRSSAIGFFSRASGFGTACDGVAASHISGCVEQGRPDVGMDLSAVHLTDLTGKGERSVGKVVHHRGVCGFGHHS